MQSYHPMMLDIAEQMMLKWERLTPEDEIDVADDMTRLTLDTIGLCGFDYRFNSFYREGNHPLVDAMITTLETTMKTRGLPLETLIKKDQQRKLERDVRYMNEMVDGHRPRAAQGRRSEEEGQDGPARLHALRRRQEDRRRARRRQHPLTSAIRS
jgi:cytochrome P450/NADPH-cytochrome P450 reductase